MFDEVAGDERENSMVFGETKNFGAIERGEIAVGDASEPLRIELHASESAEEIEHVLYGR